MKKGQFRTIIIIALLLLNLGTLGYLWMLQRNTEHKPPRGEKPGEHIVNALQLDEQQEKAFHILGRSHKSQLDSVHRIMKGAQSVMFEMLGNSGLSNVKKDSLLQVIKSAEEAKQLIIISHFSDVRQLLKPNQFPLFQQLMVEIGNNVGAPPEHGGVRRGHRPPPPMH